MEDCKYNPQALAQRRRTGFHFSRGLFELILSVQPPSPSCDREGQIIFLMTRDVIIRFLVSSSDFSTIHAIIRFFDHSLMSSSLGFLVVQPLEGILFVPLVIYKGIK